MNLNNKYYQHHRKYFIHILFEIGLIVINGIMHEEAMDIFKVRGTCIHTSIYFMLISLLNIGFVFFVTALGYP